MGLQNSVRSSSLILLILGILIGGVLAKFEDDPEERTVKLSFCGNEKERSIARRLLYVTTLDGKLTTLDISQSGKEHWSLNTSPGPLISSNIHHLELTNNGKFVRLIPSLSGGIYKFDGDTIDPIPVTVDNLLSSSFKFSDDLVISGGKETKSYGVSVRTGQVLYECNMKGCNNYTDTFSLDEKSSQHDPLLDDVLVVRRQSQIVRAVEPRTGHERWNFSVGRHELEVLQSPECHDRPMTELELSLLDLEVKLIVPEGIICGFSRSNPDVMLWKYQFDSPIVSAWILDGKSDLKSLDTFNIAQWVWTPEPENLSNENSFTPSIYLGMYNKQLYIQESSKMWKLITDKMHDLTAQFIPSHLPSIPWRPIPATRSALALINDDILGDSTQSEDVNTSVTALSILYASEYVNGNGFYLYTSEDLNRTETAFCNSNDTIENGTSVDIEFNFASIDPQVQIIIMSLWYWWKEVLVISLTSALVLNLLLSPKVRRERQVVVIERHIPVPTALEATEENISRTKSSGRTLSESDTAGEEFFTSRFQSDFDLIQCLGKGGFGVVFEARNKLDDRNYAVKRISLSNKKESRDKVLREVKTLANCEHQNIVRYFQAWVETPPSGWQETEDQKWLHNDFSSTTIDIETPDGTVSQRFPKNVSVSATTSLLNSSEKSDLEWSLRLRESSLGPKIGRKYECDDQDDSFIQFKDESKTVYDNAAIAIDINSNTHDLPNRISSSERSQSKEIEVPSQNEDCSKIWSDLSQSNSHAPALQRKNRPTSLGVNGGNAIVQMQKKSPNRTYLYIQMQLCRKESLREWLRENKTEMRRPHIKNIFEQIVDAVDYVHLKGLIHRDLKPSNIFFSLDGQIKIGDFGLVTDMANAPNYVDFGNMENLSPFAKHTQQVGTHLYMSPEQINKQPYDYKVDIYSLGLIFFELIKYFDTEMERILTLKGVRDGNFPPNFKESFPREFELLILMLSITPQERPPTFEIKKKLSSINPWTTSQLQPVVPVVSA